MRANEGVEVENNRVVVDDDDDESKEGKRGRNLVSRDIVCWVVETRAGREERARLARTRLGLSPATRLQRPRPQSLI